MAILKGALNPAPAGTTTFPELKTVQVTAPNRHSVRPSLVLDFANSKTLDPRVTFSRNSSASYYDGSTALAEQNLIPNSQSFSGGVWGNVGEVTITSNYAAAPDGTVTASKIIPTTTSAIHRIYTGTIGSTLPGILTYSIFAKADGYTQLGLFINGPDKGVLYDLNAGTASDTAYSPYTGASYTITSIGSGWYRCTLSAYSSTGNITNIQIQVMSGGTGTFAGNGTSGIAIWGVQLENRIAASAYTPTTTPVTKYIPVLKTASSNQPRFDFDPITFESKGLLIEDQRTNLLWGSADLGSAYWNLTSNMTVFSNAAVAPDGTLTAEKLVAGTGSSQHYSYQAAGVGNAAYTFSSYCKAGEYNYINLDMSDNIVGDASAVFNLANGTVYSTTFNPIWANGSASITPAGNGWYRCSITATRTASGSGVYCYYYACNNTPSTTFTGNGFNGVYAWGAQLEAGSFPTSYIPTTGAGATRAADSVSISNAVFMPIYNNNSGTFYAEFNSRMTGSTPDYPYILAGNSSSNRAAFLYTGTGVPPRVTYGFYSVGGGGVVAGSTFSNNVDNKAASAYDSTGRSIATNGTVLSTSTPNNMYALVNGLFIGSSGYQSANNFTGTIKKVSYYPVCLSSAELQSLTTT